jgi:hypothetical protein
VQHNGMSKINKLTILDVRLRIIRNFYAGNVLSVKYIQLYAENALQDKCM